MQNLFTHSLQNLVEGLLHILFLPLFFFRVAAGWTIGFDGGLVLFEGPNGLFEGELEDHDFIYEGFDDFLFLQLFVEDQPVQLE